MNHTANPPVSRADAFGLGLVATGAVSVAVAALVAVIRGAFEVFGAQVTVRMPVNGGDVPSLDAVADISSAAHASADVTFNSLPVGVRWLLLLEGALPALATIGVCAVAWWLGVSLIRNRPFRKTMSTTIGIAACLVTAGGLFGQLFGAIGRASIVDALAASDPDIYNTFSAFSIDLDLAPLGWGFALALVATAFSVGTRMQKDTEGLV